jgi:hypothetical protein
MSRNILILLCLVILLIIPKAALADCINLGGQIHGGFSSFSLKDGNKIILYSGSVPVAKFDIQDCKIKPTSKIRLLKSYMCDGDKIEIDGESCVMLDVQP